MNRLVGYVADADLRQGYDGLSKKAKLTTLKPGEFVAFVNTAKNKVKLCTHSDVTAYLRLPKGKIDPRVIINLPQYFSGGVIDYDKAMRASLEKRFPKWFESNPTN